MYGGELGGVEGGDNVVKVYCMREEFIFNKNLKELGGHKGNKMNRPDIVICKVGIIDA